MKPITLSFALLIMITACAPGGVRLSQQDISSTYNPGEFARAAAGRDTHVMIVGNLFGGALAAFETAVTDAMQGRHWGQPTNFTTAPGAEARPTYRVVLIFDPPKSFNAARQCREEALAVQTTPTGDEISLSGAYCRGRDPMTRIWGRVSGAAGAPGPAVSGTGRPGHERPVSP